MTTTVAESITGWDATLDVARVKHAFSPAAAAEVRRFLAAQPVLDRLARVQQIEEIPLDRAALPNFLRDVRAMEHEARHGLRFVVAEAVPGLTLAQQMAVPWVMSQALGRTLAQNEAGHRFYIIADRGGKMELGARYSQTSQGGSFHTDGVNVKEGYDFFLLSCVAPAAEGGESILLDGHTVYRDLCDHAPHVLPALQRERVWEYKGVRPGEFYREPILKLIEGRPVWRYLRDYIEEAARKQSEPVDADSRAAMDRLDAALGNPAFQFRYTLRAGETAIVNDRCIFHGRTPFRDAPGAVSIEQRLAGGHDAALLGRTYSRFWVNP